MIVRECDVETPSDFARYYSTSYVGWHGRQKGEVTPTFVGREGINDTIALKFFDNKNGTFGANDWEYHTFEKIKQHIDFGRPKLGMLNDGPTVVFLSQTSPREPRKGLRIREARVFEFNEWETRKILIRANNFSDRLDWVWRAFNPEIHPFSTSIQQLQDGSRIGVAISSDLGVYTVPNALYPLVAYKRWTIGYVRNEALINIHPIYGEYEQELRRITDAEVVVA